MKGENTHSNYSSINHETDNIPNDDDDSSSHDSLVRKIGDGNCTFYLIIGLVTSLAFFAPFTFNIPLIEARNRQPFGPCMWTHLIGSVIISLACLWNIFHTPSHGNIYTILHRWIGRVGLVSSVVGAFFGFIVAWFERKIDTGQAIALTILGGCQIWWTFESYRTIRVVLDERTKNLHPSNHHENNGLQQEHSLATNTTTTTNNEQKVKEELLISKHKEAVVNLWMFCLAPAWLRVPQFFGASADSNLMFIGLVFTIPFAIGTLGAIERGSFW